QIAAAAPTPETAAMPAASHAPAPPPSAPVAKRPQRPPIRGQDAPKPGLIAAIARLPKPVIFGGFFAIALVIIVLGQIFAPADPARQNTATSAGSTPSTAADSKPAGETNEQIIARHLTEGKALVEKGEYEAAIRDHFDRILIIDPNHAEATDLKARADEKL